MDAFPVFFLVFAFPVVVTVPAASSLVFCFPFRLPLSFVPLGLLVDDLSEMFCPGRVGSSLSSGTSSSSSSSMTVSSLGIGNLVRYDVSSSDSGSDSGSNFFFTCRLALSNPVFRAAASCSSLVTCLELCFAFAVFVAFRFVDDLVFWALGARLDLEDDVDRLSVAEALLFPFDSACVFRFSSSFSTGRSISSSGFSSSSASYDTPEGTLSLVRDRAVDLEGGLRVDLGAFRVEAEAEDFDVTDFFGRL